MLELITALAVWRITYMICYQEGPIEMFSRLRGIVDGAQDRLGFKLFNFGCVSCLSVWIAFPFAVLITDGWQIVAYWFFFSAISTLIDSSKMI